jgi:dipeptidyl aminopeptidase/acylaminoacyl peptidase
LSSLRTSPRKVGCLVSGIFNVDVSEESKEIALVATDQQRLPDVWVFDTQEERVRQVSHLNSELDRYELGRAVTLEWRSREGKPLRGAMLLPPDYVEGTPLPMVVWIYGGMHGSKFIHRFGFWGDDSPTLNMHVLATRGYAVLFPDAPLRAGNQMADLIDAVMPGVDTAVEKGIADPDRLAIMGHSYGSYCALALICQTRQFKAAVISAATIHPDLSADYARMMGYYETGQGNMGGALWEYPDRYRDNSPLFRFNEIGTPLLIGQGEHDGDLVPSRVIFDALKRLGKPVEYRVYQGEEHVISRKPNARDFWERRLTFLAEHLDLQVARNGRISVAGTYLEPSE